MPTGKESCPLCNAQPCDWVDDPHQSQDALFLALADLRLRSGVGEKPMLTELPAVIGDRLNTAATIMAALKDLVLAPEDRTIFGKGREEWRRKATDWLLNENGA